MKTVLRIAGAVSLLCLSAQVDKPSSDELPPARYRDNTSATIIFVPGDRVAAACRQPPPPPGFESRACSGIGGDGHRYIVIPNPCRFRPGSYYAQILCHEIGHLNGWPASHGN